MVTYFINGKIELKIDKLYYLLYLLILLYVIYLKI